MLALTCQGLPWQPTYGRSQVVQELHQTVLLPTQHCDQRPIHDMQTCKQLTPIHSDSSLQKPISRKFQLPQLPTFFTRKSFYETQNHKKNVQETTHMQDLVNIGEGCVEIRNFGKLLAPSFLYSSPCIQVTP